MTIFVKPKTFHETLAFDANDWETDDEGRLWIGTGDVGVAEFNTGEWLYVYETTEEDSEPREWDSIDDVPVAVRVRDTDGDTWVYNREKMEWGWIGNCSGEWISGNNFRSKNLAPFVEVVK